MKGKETKILLVEDDHFILAMYSGAFVTAGFLVRGVMTGEEAVAEALSFKPDLITLDIMLPGQDGFSVLKDLKDNQLTASTPVVMLSNLSEAKYRERSLIYGAADYWVKAYLDPQEVVEKIKALLKIK